MLAIAAGAWWKTSHADPGPDPLDPDPNLGVATFGAAPEPVLPVPAKAPASSEASLPVPASSTPAAEPLAEAGAADAQPSATGLPPAGGGDPKEPQSAANEPLSPQAAPLKHVVRSGETLYRIVLRAYGSAPAELVEAVAKANGLRDAGAISEGQTLTLPSLAGWPAPKRP